MADGGAPRAWAPRQEGPPADPAPEFVTGRMGSFDWDLDAGVLDLDPAALSLVGLDPASYDGRAETAIGLITPTEAARVRAQARLAVRQRSDSFGAYYRLVGPDGMLRVLHSQARIHYDGVGRPRRIVGIVREAEESHRTPGYEHRGPTGVTERLTTLMERAVTVNDVSDALNDERVLGRLGARGVILGMVEGGRIHTLTHPSFDEGVPIIGRPGLDEPLPMAESVTLHEPLFVSSPAEYRAKYPTMWPGRSPFPVGAGAYLPLVAEGRTIGALAVLYREAQTFSEWERNLLITLGSGIAQSLQRAMLHGQEHDLAESLQKAMLPRRIPPVPGAALAVRYRSAGVGRSVGGDWYDVVPLADGRVGLTIGDVQGHDTDAAVVMGQLRMVLSAYVAEGHPPATAVARTSTFLRELDTDRFATCTYVQADMVTGHLQIVRAGHLDVLVRRRDGTCQWLPSHGGLPLGLSDEFSGSGAIDYPVTSALLGRGETLLLCTDGLVELPGTDLGSRMRVLSEAVQSGPAGVEELATRLLDMASDQNGGDDMALLILRRDDAPPASRDD